MCHLEREGKGGVDIMYSRERRPAFKGLFVRHVPVTLQPLTPSVGLHNRSTSKSGIPPGRIRRTPVK